jgi:BlaI family penicillinase repressor
LTAFYKCRRRAPVTRTSDSPQPSDGEWKVLNALWRRHPANARELLDELSGETAWAYTTLKTMLTRMEEKGFVRTEMRGNTAWYSPALERGRAQRSALRSLIDRVFDGAAGPLLAHLADDASLSPAERKKLEGWLADVGRDDGSASDRKGTPRRTRRGTP